MATLPAIDANDEPKSLAAFRFYCCVLGSLGQLPVRPRCMLAHACLPHFRQRAAPCLGHPQPPWLHARLSKERRQAAPYRLLLPPRPPCSPAPQEAPSPSLPLYSEEWLEELLSRVFAIITNLDSPEHRGGWCGFGNGSGLQGAAILLCCVLPLLDTPETGVRQLRQQEWPWAAACRRPPFVQCV